MQLVLLCLALHVSLDSTLQIHAHEYWPELSLHQGTCLVFISG